MLKLHAPGGGHESGIPESAAPCRKYFHESADDQGQEMLKMCEVILINSKN